MPTGSSPAVGGLAFPAAGQHSADLRDPDGRAESYERNAIREDRATMPQRAAKATPTKATHDLLVDVGGGRSILVLAGHPIPVEHVGKPTTPAVLGDHGGMQPKRRS